MDVQVERLQVPKKYKKLVTQVIAALERYGSDCIVSIDEVVPCRRRTEIFTDGFCRHYTKNTKGWIED